ncbi:MAG: IS66 family transposase [Myxococcales bacterium]|nr:IS66 family transposase [Myxococcales bacterium]
MIARDYKSVVPSKAAAAENRVAKLRARVETLLKAQAELQSSFDAQRAALAAELEQTHQRALAAERERDALRRSYERLKQELELLRRRMIVATAERVDTQQLELEFAEKMREFEQAAATLGLAMSESNSTEVTEAESDPKSETESGPEKNSRSTGRRKLSSLNLPVERIELRDPVLEARVEAGEATLKEFETSYRLAYQRGGYKVIELARAKYRTADEETGQTRVKTTARPKELLEGTFFAPSLAADILYKKSSLGLPFYRQERDLQGVGVPIDRATMSRLAKRAGDLFGDTVVQAMRLDAKMNAFCIATDATGLKIQPIAHADKKRQPCKRGHVLVQIADRDHVIFDYLERETAAAIAALFEGYQGYVQADAKNVFDILYRAGPGDLFGAEPRDPREPCVEVGCWAHARRKFWEATVGERSEIAREGLYRIRRIYKLDESLASMSARQRQAARDALVRPHVEEFFAWCEKLRPEFTERGLLATAFGYAINQKGALCRFLDDGRLQLDNNRSERALRNIAIGRKNWLFAGSDDHAASLVNIFSLEASARLHRLDVAGYFRDLIRVLPYWPRDRFLELCPREFREVLGHFDLGSSRIRPGEAHENGVVEKGHDVLKSALDQALRLRGSRDFADVDAYLGFVNQIVVRDLHAGQEASSRRSARVFGRCRRRSCRSSRGSSRRSESGRRSRSLARPTPCPPASSRSRCTSTPISSRSATRERSWRPSRGFGAATLTASTTGT